MLSLMGVNDILNTDPLFVNKGGVLPDDYRLTVGSTAIDSGTLMNNNGGQDYWGQLLI